MDDTHHFGRLVDYVQLRVRAQPRGVEVLLGLRGPSSQFSNPTRAPNTNLRRYAEENRGQSKITNGGWALGDARFAQQTADAVGRRAEKLAPAHPTKDRRDERRQLRLL
jgi:hypothetical protein